MRAPINSRQRCALCGVHHGEERQIKRVRCVFGYDFRTVWRNKAKQLVCMRTGVVVEERHIESAPRNSFYIWAQHRAELRLADFGTDKKIVCGQCYVREVKAGNCLPTRRRAASVKVQKQENQKQLF